jgi:hypothetical protein
VIEHYPKRTHKLFVKRFSNIVLVYSWAAQLSTRCGAVWLFRAAEQRLAGRCREPDRVASVKAWRAGEHPHSETVEETRDGLDGGADVGDDET